jgi:flagellar hook-length control protein FliK
VCSSDLSSSFSRFFARDAYRDRTSVGRDKDNLARTVTKNNSQFAAKDVLWQADSQAPPTQEFRTKNVTPVERDKTISSNQQSDSDGLFTNDDIQSAIMRGVMMAVAIIKNNDTGSISNEGAAVMQSGLAADDSVNAAVVPKPPGEVGLVNPQSLAQSLPLVTDEELARLAEAQPLSQAQFNTLLTNLEKVSGKEGNSLLMKAIMEVVKSFQDGKIALSQVSDQVAKAVSNLVQAGTQDSFNFAQWNKDISAIMVYGTTDQAELSGKSDTLAFSTNEGSVGKQGQEVAKTTQIGNNAMFDPLEALTDAKIAASQIKGQGGNRTEANATSQGKVDLTLSNTTITIPTPIIQNVDFTNRNIETQGVQNILQQTFRNVDEMIQNGQKTLRVQLHPENLGGLELRLTSQGGSLQVAILADSSMTQQVLERHVQDLQQVLINSGVNLAGLTVGQRGSQDPTAGNNARTSHQQRSFNDDQTLEIEPLEGISGLNEQSYLSAYYLDSNSSVDYRV